MAVSIIIPTLNRFNSLKKTVSSIFVNTTTDFEIIIVDQSDKNNSNKTELLSKYKSVNYICEKRKNLPNARNIGIKNAKHNTIIFFDDDTIIHKGCIKEHELLHNKNKNIIVSGRVIQSGNIQWDETSDISLVSNLTANTTCNFDKEDFNGKIEYAVGAHFSCTKKIFEQAGLFDPSFYRNALYEDADFCFRAKKSGVSIIYSPNAIVTHIHLLTGGCRENDNTHNFVRIHNQTLFYLRHISIIPRKEFLYQIYYITEFITRNKEKKYHSLFKLFQVFFTVLISIKNLIKGYFYLPRLR